MKKEIDEILAQLSKIEAASAKIIDIEKNDEEKYSLYIEKVKKEFDEQLEKKTNEKIDEIRNRLITEKNNDLAKLKEDSQKDLVELERKYEKNHKKWAAGILQELIKE